MILIKQAKKHKPVKSHYERTFSQIRNPEDVQYAYFSAGDLHL